MEDRLKELKRELWSNVQCVIDDNYVEHSLAVVCCEKAYRKAIDDVLTDVMNITEAMYKRNEEKFYELHQKKYKHYNNAIKKIWNELDRLKEELKEEQEDEQKAT